MNPGDGWLFRTDARRGATRPTGNADSRKGEEPFSSMVCPNATGQLRHNRGPVCALAHAAAETGDPQCRRDPAELSMRVPLLGMRSSIDENRRRHDAQRRANAAAGESSSKNLQASLGLCLCEVGVHGFIRSAPYKAVAACSIEKCVRLASEAGQRVRRAPVGGRSRYLKAQT